MKRTAAVALAALLSTAFFPHATSAMQQIPEPRVVPVQVTGDPAARFSLVIMGDGYTAAEMGRYRAHLEKHLNIMWSLEPFRSYRNYINVYSVEVASPESGITCDPAHRQKRNTAIKLYYDGGCENPNARGVLVDEAIARKYAALATPAFDQILVIGNTDTYGGIGGRTATTTGANALSPYITPHELGHSLGRLQDEYTYSARGVKGPAFTGAEPSSIHHTILSAGDMIAQQKKWWRWLGVDSEAGGKIGLFEGGQQRVSGIWRPSKHSMMISLGYYFDQVSRERLTQRISEQVELITASTPTDGVLSNGETIWIETAHPVYHELRTQWSVDGYFIGDTFPNSNRRFLPLQELRLKLGAHSITVKVWDPTDFVRDPLIRDTSFSATRTWNVNAVASPAAITRGENPKIVASTSSSRPVGGTDVVYVETTHPAGDYPAITWELDGKLTPGFALSFPLASAGLSPGTHTLTARSRFVGMSKTPEVSWTIDNTPPAATYQLGGNVRRVSSSPDTWIATDSFTMKLLPTDDQPGYVVAEFRVNGDGWHHYYGWPDAPPDEPFHFTARGTTIKELVYGSLSSEGLSPQPWEPRLPGWGTHVIEYRARDAAGNIGPVKTFRVTLSPSLK